MGEVQYTYIGDLPEAVKKTIAAVFDACGPPNWRSLMTDVIPLYKRENASSSVYKFAMETLLPGGSPTTKLLDDLARKRRTVVELINWISSMPGRTAGVETVLNVLKGAPVVTGDIHGEVFTATHGQDVNIRCEAISVGSVPLHFQWFKRGNELRGKTQSTLLLQNVTQDDEGLYVCRVANWLGVAWTGWAKLTITRGQETFVNQNFDFPIITCQSESPVCVVQGSVLRLYCDGVGRPAPHFQWYKNNVPVERGTCRELVKEHARNEDRGEYFCKVYNSAGEVSSELIRVNIAAGEQVTPRGPERERVPNKVALLIGNEDYQHDQNLGKLYHPINDVCALTGSLLNMEGFKVVSLVNLTLQEMKEALRQFCRLLVEDTYAVFYFAGHGFECSGHSYLMPVDATDQYHPRENMASSDVLKAMQETKAKLSVVLLDCCRSEANRDPSQNVLLLQGGDVHDIKKPNVVLAFACCPQSCVFECKNENNGFFAKHLLENLSDEHRNKCIEEVLLNVSSGIDRENLEDPLTNQKQVVNRITTLVKPMCLWCPVDSSLMNPATAAATEQWQSAHEIPNEPVIVFLDDHDRIKVELNFNAEVSNVLIVNARALGDDQLGCTVTFDMSGVVSGCRVERNSTTGTDKIKCRPNEATLKVKDLQRLTGPLVLKLTVMYMVNGDRIWKEVSYTMAEKPLYAKLVTRW